LRAGAAEITDQLNRSCGRDPFWKWGRRAQHGQCPGPPQITSEHAHTTGTTKTSTSI